MNRNVMGSMIRKTPESPKESYIFVNDNLDICKAILTVEFRSLYISKTGDAYFTAESFCEFIRDVSESETEIMKYTFVLACYRKKTNDAIAEVLKNNFIPYLEGAYTLFKNKEYLGKYERQGELERDLDAYIKRFEGSEAGTVDKLEFCLFGATGALKGIHDYKVVQYLLKTVCMFVAGEQLYVYRGGYYFLDRDGIYIKSKVQGLIPEQFISHRNLNAVYNLLLEQQEIQKTFEEINNYPPWWINFKNGMFDVKERKLRPHRPDYLAINQIPHDLDFELRKRIDDTEWEIDKFLKAAIPDADDRTMLWQYIGYCMTRDTGMQKFMIIKGVGGTGKSRIINLIQEIVGDGNYSGISLQDLNQKFYPSLLLGKLLNACADISSEALTSVDNIKKATGEDIMLYEPKGKDAKPFRSYAKLLFSANKIPLNLDEKTNALYRRMLILEMNQIPEKPDPDLDRKLEKETGYAIWMAVSGLNTLYKNGKISESRRSRELVEELYRAADTVKAFMDECTEHKPGERMEKTLLYDSYEEYCKSWKRKELSQRAFYAGLEEKGYRFKKSGGKRYILDVAFKDEGFDEDGEGEGSRIFRQDKGSSGAGKGQLCENTSPS